MTLWRGLKEPTAPPPVNVELEKRLDKVDVRLETIVHQAREAQKVIRSSPGRR